jgi:hypothetical protein
MAPRGGAVAALVQHVVCAALCACLLAGTASAGGECRDYIDTLPDNTLGFCAGVVTYAYYAASASVKQRDLELSALQRVRNPRSPFAGAADPKLDMLLPLVGERCQAGLKLAACLASFPRCEPVDPFFVNRCGGLCAANGTCSDNGALRCSPGVGLQAGAASTPWTSTTCTQSGFQFRNGACVQALPRLPCRAACTRLNSFDKSLTSVGQVLSAFSKTECPLMSGPFLGAMTNAKGVLYKDDADFVAQVSAVIAGKPNATAGTIFTANVLALAGALPLCSAAEPTGGVVVTGQAVPLLTFPNGQQAELASLLQGNAGKAPAGTPAAAIAKAAAAGQCAPLEEAGAATVQPAVDVAGPDSACFALLSQGDNQDQTLEEALNKQDASKEANFPSAVKCVTSRKYAAVYVVPPALGMPPLAGRYDPQARTEAHADPFAVNCSASALDPVARPLWATLQGPVPLCRSAALGGRQAFNARDCVALKVETAAKLFPRWAPPRCRAAFMEMLCAQTMMKPALKSVCLAPGGCDALPEKAVANGADRVGLTFVLPRFPRKALCQTYLAECDAFLRFLDATRGPSATAKLRPACDATVSAFAGECDNAELAQGTWGCASPFKDLPAFPDQTQDFGAQAALQLLGALTGGAAQVPAQAFQSAASGPTLSGVLYANPALNGTDKLTLPQLKGLQQAFCECPAPLVRPDSIETPTLSNATCCALPCEGTMVSKAQLNSLGVLQLALASAGLLLALFMVLTWGLFESKKRQYITFWFSFCSLMTSATLLAGVSASGANISATVCKDNATPHSMKVTGLTLCAVTSFTLLFFSLAECMWWAIQAIDLFRKIVLHQRDTDRSKMAYHLLAWAVPSLAVLGMLLRQRAGFAGPTPFCFFAGDTPVLEQYVLYFFFVMFCFVLGSALMVSVLVTIYRHTSSVAKLEGSSKGDRLLKKYSLFRTPLTFVFMFIVVWVIIFSYRLQGTLQEGTFRAQASAWVDCLLANFAGGIDDPANDPKANTTMLVGAPAGQQGCGVTQPGGLPFVLTITMFVAVSSQSIAVFAIFGLKWENLTLWMQALGCMNKDGAVQDREEPSSFTQTDTDGPAQARGGARPGYEASPYATSPYAMQQGAFNSPPVQFSGSPYSLQGGGASAPPPPPPGWGQRMSSSLNMPSFNLFNTRRPPTLPPRAYDRS